MAENRTNNSIKNIVTAIFNQALVTLLTFLTRTILVKQLGAEYVGVNGLFTNIIAMLSLAELGINLAIPFSLYKPLAENDYKKINVLMSFYSKIYRVIGTAVLVLGAALTPFLPFFVSAMPDIPYLSGIYLLFVVNSGISYFWIYKSLLITSDQKAYVLTRINNMVSIILAVSQCLMLFLTRNFIVYLLCSTVLTLAKNIYISKECDKRYPYIKEKIRDKISRNELKEIKKNVFAVCLDRVGTVLLNSTDGIIISKFLSVAMNGFYSNYTMVPNAVHGILSQISNGVIASVGNAAVTEKHEYNHLLFKRLDFINFWLYGVCGVCLWNLINPFILVWLGAEYQLDGWTAWAIAMNFYILGSLGTTFAFRNTFGLFWRGKLRPVIMSVINIALDIILVLRIGVFGVVAATLISRLVTTVWYDPYIVFKYGFKKTPKKYYITYTLRFLLVNALGLIGSNIMKNTSAQDYTWGKWFLIAILFFVGVNIIFLLVYSRTEEFNYLKKKLFHLAQQRRKNC